MPLPNSLPWMEGVDAKIARAKVHLRVFESDAASFLRTARPTFTRKVNQEGTEHWLVFYTPDPFPPVELSVMIGDVLYNTRSASDNLICGLVRTRNPTSTCSGRQFPIFKEPAEYLSRRREMLRGVPRPARTVIDGLQPWCQPENTRELDPLWILNILCNRDKHRAINVMLCYNRDVELFIPAKDRANDILIRIDRPIYAGDVDTLPLPRRPSDIDDNVQVQIRGKSVLTFRSADSWSERRVDELLRTLLDYVENRVIDRCKQFFR